MIVKACGVDGDGGGIHHTTLTLPLRLLRLLGLGSLGSGVLLRFLRRLLRGLLGFLGRLLRRLGLGRDGKDLLQRFDLIAFGQLVEETFSWSSSSTCILFLGFS